MERVSVLVLVPGGGGREEGGLCGALAEVLFKPAAGWALSAARAAGAGRVCVAADERLLGPLSERLGPQVPVAALSGAADFLRARPDDDVAVLRGDAPLMTAGVLKGALALHRKNGADATAVTVRGEPAPGPDAGAAAGWFRCRALLAALESLPDGAALCGADGLVKKVVSGGGRAQAYEAGDPDVALTAGDGFGLLAVNEKARRRELRRVLAAGAVVPCADGVMVGPDVEIGAGTVLLPGTILRGRTRVGGGCVLGPNSLLEDCTVGDGVKFNASQAYQSDIGDGVSVGPFSHLRPHTALRARVHVGDFVELKNSTVGAGTKVPHLTYVGDSDVGERVNFGCGCVTVNYDGVVKHRTVVGDHAFIGCNTNLVAPVRVGENAYTAAGSTITRDVPKNALAVARSRQQNIEGWVTRRRPQTPGSGGEKAGK